MSVYCANPVGDYVPDPCGLQLAGGIRDLVIFIDELPTDPSDGAEITAMIAAGTAKLITQVKVGLEAPSEVTTTSYIACVSDPVVNYDRTATLMDATVSADNVDFYNTVNSASGFVSAGALFHECDAERCTFVDKSIVFSGGRVIPDQNNDSQRFEFTLRWRSKTDGEIVTCPAGIFV